MIEAIDSHYRWVKSRILALNPNRTVVGIVDAMDWPPKEINFESFYLIVLGSSVPQGMFSPTAMGMSTVVQWAWMIEGDDLTSATRGRNRGDRYRKHWTMLKELMNGLYPYFCEKKSWSAQQDGTGAIQLTSTSMNPVEQIWWSRPRIMPSTPKEEKSGILVGGIQTSIGQSTDQITS